IDEVKEKEASAYGHVLGILMSRADSASQDLADAISWRLKQSQAAAERAGLTNEERRLLRSPPVAPVEQWILDRVEAAPGADELTHLAEALRPALAAHQRVVIFCGAGALASRVAAGLEREYPLLAVGEHTRRVGAEAADVTVAAWRKSGGVLVADDS